MNFMEVMECFEMMAVKQKLTPVQQYLYLNISDRTNKWVIGVYQVASYWDRGGMLSSHIEFTKDWNWKRSFDLSCIYM